MSKAFLKKFGVDALDEFEAADLVGQEAECKVKLEDNGEYGPQNRIS
jgi:hypothetical protein